MAIDLFGPSAVMARAQGFAQAIQKFWWLSGRRGKAGVLANGF
jgi:hypothetical protein